MALIDVLDVHLAVLSGKREQKAGEPFDVAHPVIYGTAFGVAPGLFLTAAHVYQDASSDGLVALARLADGPGHVGLVSRAEVFTEFDLALLVCRYFADERGLLPIDFGSLTIFDEVSAVGFPFSIDPERLTWTHRGFKGHIVTRRAMYQMAGQPPGYELSFVPPPGLSGAPLISDRTGSPAICGYIVQHFSTETAGVRTDLGIAVSSDVLLWIESEIVGGPLARIWKREKTERGRLTPIRNVQGEI